uniref:Uncharacterized protein n=1 Tax=Paramormyrops kingsleyae TaxID=1676925 RepID=A0A3B3R7Y2_9TELE
MRPDHLTRRHETSSDLLRAATWLLSPESAEASWRWLCSFCPLSPVPRRWTPETPWLSYWAWRSRWWASALAWAGTPGRGAEAC